MLNELKPFKHKKYSEGFSVKRSLLDRDPSYRHFLLGEHGSFSGRKYRRGKNRCSFCGAPKDSKPKGGFFLFSVETLKHGGPGGDG